MFIISEISPQFGNDLDIAEQMILQSKMAGANAAKIQLYPTALFFGETPDPYVKSRELSFEDFKRLKIYGDKIGIPVFATAFDNERLEWCDELDQQYYKIAARQHVERPDIVEKVIENTAKRIFVSVPNTFPISEVIVKENCIYLHCVNRYPTLLEDVIIPDFAGSIFSGISDHSLGIATALFAAANGAGYIEKHFTTGIAGQRHNETGHLGAMNFEELMRLKTLSREMGLIYRRNQNK